MPRIGLTKSAIDSLPTAESDVVYWDAGYPGFGVKVTPKGRKVFIVLYRAGGAGSKLRKYTIGPYGRGGLKVAQDVSTLVRRPSCARGLMSYGENLSEFFRRAASFVDKSNEEARVHNRPFCDGHHSVEVKTAISLYASKWANGRVPCLLPLYLWKHLR